MTRRELITMAAVAWPGLAIARDGVWGRPHKDPRTLVQSDVDPLMWPIVQRVNRTGWVWTAESCEGHDDGRPVMLGLVTNDPARVLSILSRAAIVAGGPPRGGEGQSPSGVKVMTAYYLEPKLPLGSTQMQFAVSDLPRGRRMFGVFASQVEP